MLCVVLRKHPDMPYAHVLETLEEPLQVLPTYLTENEHDAFIRVIRTRGKDYELLQIYQVKNEGAAS